ncbi:unnamed protein product [Jaminaea pallidilutea]
MVQSFSAQSQLPLPWPVLAQAYFLRYPNPFAQHVLSVDVIDRRIIHRPTPPTTDTPTTTPPSATTSSIPVLHTSRILLKKGTLPRWAPKGLIKSAESWVLEVTEVDLETPRIPMQTNVSFNANDVSRNVNAEEQDRPARQMRTWTRNLDHTTVLAVAESLTFTENSLQKIEPGSAINGAQKFPNVPRSTHCLTGAHITSDVGVLWKRIEKFGLKRFMAHMETSRQGLLHAASQMSPASGSTTDRPYPPPALPPPSTAFTRMREALRPPWLDGLPPAPSIARVRQTMRERYARLKEEGWMGGSGRREREEGMKRWREELRERLVRFRQWRPASSSGAAAAKSDSGEAGIKAGSVAAQSSPSEISDAPTQRVPRSSAAGDPREQGATTTTQNRLETASAASSASSVSPSSPPFHRADSQSHDEPIETQRERLAKLMHEVRSGKPLARE